MIFKIKFEDDVIDWCTAKDILHLLKSYDSENDLNLQQIESIEEISEETAKTTMVNNLDYNEDNPEDMETISLFDLAVGNEFCVIASTEF